MTDADFARDARSTKDVGILALGGAIMIDIVIVVLNTYSGSLSLSNLFDGLLGHNVGRPAMVVLANILGLLMIAGDILGYLLVRDHRVRRATASNPPASAPSWRAC